MDAAPPIAADGFAKSGVAAPKHEMPGKREDRAYEEVAMILDAYLGAEQVRRLLEHTQVTRFLVSSNPRQHGRVTTAGVLLSTWKDETGDMGRELRRAKFHDRIIVSQSSVHVLGASLNGVRKGSPTVLYRMPGAAADSMRQYAEGLWESAQTGATVSRSREA